MERIRFRERSVAPPATRARVGPAAQFLRDLDHRLQFTPTRRVGSTFGCCLAMMKVSLGNRAARPAPRMCDSVTASDRRIVNWCGRAARIKQIVGALSGLFTCFGQRRALSYLFILIIATARP